MSHPLDPYAELIGKVSAEQIATTAGVELSEVEAWLAERNGEEPEPEPKKKRQGKQRSAEPTTKTPPRRIEAIKVLETTAISVENARGQRLRIPVPCSIYRGKLARKYAELLRPDEFRVIEYAR